jgi:hypothetical protein
MPTYRTNHRYRSGTFPGWDAGVTVDLTDAEAEWVNHDSPGALTLVEPEPEPEPVAPPTAPEPPPTVEPPAPVKPAKATKAAAKAAGGDA